MRKTVFFAVVLSVIATGSFAQTLSPGYGGSLPPAYVPSPMMAAPTPTTQGGVPPFADPYGTTASANRFGPSPMTAPSQGTYGTSSGVQTIQDAYGTRAAETRFGTPANR